MGLGRLETYVFRPPACLLLQTTPSIFLMLPTYFRLELECFHLLRLRSQHHLVGRQHYKAASPSVLSESYFLVPFQSWI